MTTPTPLPHSTTIASSTALSSGTLAPSTSTSTTVPYPRDYFFPPFFTRQPVPTTHHAQCAKWSSWILSYCRFHRLWKLSLVDAIDSELFWNRKIDRRLGINDAREVLEWMRGQGRVEWISTGRGGGEGVEGKNVCWVWWRTPEEWAVLIAEWVEETGQKNTVLTLYELTESEATVSQEFHGMDPEVLQKALYVLVKRGKAQVFGQEDQQGVKFF